MKWTVPAEGAALQRLRVQVREFLAGELDAGRFVPRTDAWQAGFDPDFSRRLAAMGWVGMCIPEEYGGHGRSSIERFVVTEELLAAGAPVGAHWIADRQMAPSLLRNGTEEQKRAYLPGIAAGETYFCIGMSEPDSGSDLASVRTKAIPDGAGWRIEGTKVWTTAAHIAHAIVVLARTEPGASRHAGLSQFVIDLPHPDVEVRPITTIDGEHHFNEVVFHGARVEQSALLGRLGEGWTQVTSELANERSGPERILSTLPLVRDWSHDCVSGEIDELELGRLLSRLIALRLMSLAVADRLARGEEPATEAAIVKDLGTQFEGDAVECVRRRVGSTDPREDGSVGQLLHQSVLHVPAFTLRGGTTEVLRSIVAKAVIR